MENYIDIFSKYTKEELVEQKDILLKRLSSLERISDDDLEMICSKLAVIDFCLNGKAK